MDYNRRRIESIKQRYPEGTRICVDSMGDDPRPIESGTKGTVDWVDDIGTVHCNFDNGRRLGLIVGEDSFHVIQQEEVQENTQSDGGMNMSM